MLVMAALVTRGLGRLVNAALCVIRTVSFVRLVTISERLNSCRSEIVTSFF